MSRFMSTSLFPHNKTKFLENEFDLAENLENYYKNLNISEVL